MKKNYLIFFIIFSFFSVKIFSYQPAEQGILFLDEYKKSMRRLRPGLRSRPIIQRANMSIDREKREDGTESLVFRIDSLSQFLFLIFTSTKPIMVKLFSNNNSSQGAYQKLADKFRDEVIFLSINTLTNLPLVQILLLILCSKGISLEQIKGKFPLFLFCKRDFAIFHNGSVSFKKDSLQLLCCGKIGDGEGLIKAIRMVLSQKIDDPNVIGAPEVKFEEKESRNVVTRDSTLQKMRERLQELKKWLKSLFSRKK